MLIYAVSIATIGANCNRDIVNAALITGGVSIGGAVPEWLCLPRGA